MYLSHWLAEEGATGSPKIILRTAYRAGMIKNEDAWLRALQERNNVTHSYNEKIDILTTQLLDDCAQTDWATAQAVEIRDRKSVV